MSIFPWLTAAIVLLVGLIQLLVYLKGKRKRAMVLTAVAVGLELEEYGPELKLLEDTGLPFFVDGRNGVGKYLLRFPEMDGVKGYYFDYSCLLGSGKTQRKRQSTVALYECGKGAFPDFHLSAVGDIPDEAEGLDPANMAHYKGFPPGVKLFGRDQAALQKLFTPELAAAFSEHPGWSAQGSVRSLVIYRGFELIDPSKYKDFIVEAGTLAYAIAQHGGAV